MKILLVHRYFWPDSPPYASILRSIAEKLAADGHQVDVLTAQPSYGGTALHETAPKSEVKRGVSIERAPLLSESKAQPIRRAVNLALFAARVLSEIGRRRDYDVVMAATTPPVLVALASRLASKMTGAKFVYHMQDIYPEVLGANSGQPLSVPLRLLRQLDAITTRTADRVVVLSVDMRESLAKRGHGIDHVRLINNFMPDSTHFEANPDEVEIGPMKPNSFQVVFAGNLGKFQGLNVVVDAFHDLNERGIKSHLVLLGGGAAEHDLRAQAGSLMGETVFFPGRVSQGKAEQVVAISDLALVTLNPGVIGTAFPSKTMTYLSCGTPVLAAVEDSSELAQVLRSNEVGASCDLTAHSIAAEIEKAMFADPVRRDVVRGVANAYASQEVRLPQWSTLFGELDG